MGLRDDIKRYNDIGEEKRMDLSEFIKEGNLGNEDIKVPIKIIQLPEFEYDQIDQGGVGQGEGAEQGDPVGQPQPQPQPGEDGDGDGEDDGDEAGEGEGEHGYYEMDPEEFAEKLDDELDLNLEPKGKKVIEEVEGDYTDVSRQGPDSTLLMEHLVKQGLKRKLATEITDDEEETLKELLKVSGIGPRTAFEFARDEHSLPISVSQIEDWYDEIDNKTKYDDMDEVDTSALEGTSGQGRRLESKDIDSIPFRRQDKRHQHPEIKKKRQKNVVVVNIRDVSGSMRKNKRELVERVFTPLDWYLQGKYDHAEFIYIAHDSEAWEVDREDFFGIKSGGGTTISSAYELAQHILEEKYPWSDWNRYVFAAGDGENKGSQGGSNDTSENVIPLMEEIDANLHAYLQTGGGRSAFHADVLEDHFGAGDNVAVARVEDTDGVIPAIQEILGTEGDNE